MAIKNLIKVWDDDRLIKKNIEFLRTPTKPVQFPVSPQIEKIIANLIDTYRALPCAGIAANQLGYDRCIFIGMKHDREDGVSEDASKNIDDVEPDPDNYEIYINPQIDKVDESSTQMGEEGCLSIPNLTLNLERYDKIKIRYYNIDGRVMPKPPKPLKGFLSRLFQHELDHLKGRLMLQHKNLMNGEIWLKDKKYEALSKELIEGLLK